MDFDKYRGFAIYNNTYNTLLNIINIGLNSLSDSMKNFSHEEPVIFAKEFATVGILLPRRTGKTSAIKEAARLFNNPLIIAPTKVQCDALYKDIESHVQVVSADNIKKGLSIYDNCDIVFVDEYNFIDLKHKEFLYSSFAKRFVDKDPLLFVAVSSMN